MSKYRIEQIGADKFRLLIPLMKDCFGMDVNIGYFHWKYIDNPAGHFIGFIAIENETNEVGAYYGVVPQNFIIDGKKQTIYQSCDTMTHSEHRRLGLFKMLALECFRYLEENNKLFIIGFGGSQSTPGFLKFGWKHIFDFRYYFKPHLFCQAARMHSFSNENFKEVSDVSVLESFVSKPDQEKTIHSGRNVKHIGWRTNNPHFTYKIITFSQKEVIEGYVIFYVQKSKMILFDFRFSSNKAEKELLWYLSKEVIKFNYKGIIAYCQENGKYAKKLKRNAFVANPFKKGPLAERTPFIIFAPPDVIDKNSDASKWQMTSYDTDAL